MATFIAYTPFNADAFPFAPGATSFSIATSTHLQEVWGNSEANYYGTFTFGFDPYSGYYLAGGTITAGDYRVAGVTQFEISGLNHSAPIVYSYLEAEDQDGLYTYVLSGADSFVGSSGGDLVYGYDGNDVMSASAGNDIGYGGSGDDTIMGGDGDDVGFGDAGNDSMVGGMGADSALGGEGKDTLDGGAGNDTLDGGAGVDIAIFSGNRSAYTVGSAGSSVSGPEGTDTLTGIERLQFSDKNLAFDLGSGQAAGNTVRVIGAAFDANYLTPQFVGIGLDLFDAGMSMQAVCQLALGTNLFLSLAGSNSNEAFVNTVYKNVVGVLPSEGTRDLYVGMLMGSGGTMTQAELLVLAANAGVNATNINLVGLQQSGVEFA